MNLQQKDRDAKLRTLCAAEGFDSTLADMETAKRKGYLLRDTHKLRVFANRIYASRKRRRT